MDDCQAERAAIIRQIQQRRSSVVISIVTSDRPGLSAQLDSQMIRHVFDLTKEAIEAAQPKCLDLFFYSRGGDSDVPWALMSMLREIAGDRDIDVLIPYRAHSAATIAALGADEIIMGPKAELGPIDTTMFSPYNPPDPKTNQPLPVSVEDVMGYFSLLERIGCTGSDSKIQGLREFTQKVHPYALGMVQRLEDQTKLVAGQLLANRRAPFPDPENRAIVDAVAKRINSHNHSISRTEATRHIGLRNVVKAEDANIEKEIWQLFILYEKKFELAKHFNPEEEFFADQTLEERAFTDLAIACIESALRCRTWKCNVNMKRRRQPIQNVTVSPQIQLPPINIAPGVDPGQVHAMVQHWMQNVLPQTLQTVVDNAVREVLKAAPTIGFERRENRVAWDDVPNTAEPPPKPTDDRENAPARPRRRRKADEKSPSNGASV